MYPSKKYPHYGVFVENSVGILKNGGHIVTVCAMPKCETFISKIWHYGKLYLESVLRGALGRYDCVYAHFISHTSLPVRIIKKVHNQLIVVENAHGNDVLADCAKDFENIELSRKALKVADWIIVPSTYYKKVVSETFSIPDNKLFVSPSGGVNSTVFEPMMQ